MGFPRQEYWSGLPFPTPGDFPNPGIKPLSSALQAFFTSVPPGKPHLGHQMLWSKQGLEKNFQTQSVSE